VIDESDLIAVSRAEGKFFLYSTFRIVILIQIFITFTFS